MWRQIQGTVQPDLWDYFFFKWDPMVKSVLTCIWSMKFLLQLWGCAATLVCLGGFVRYPRAFSLTSVWKVMLYLALCCSCFLLDFQYWFFCDIFTSGYKTCLRHLRIVLKLSYRDKTYIRCLKDNLTTTNCKHAQKCLGKISNRRLIKMSTLTS